MDPLATIIETDDGWTWQVADSAGTVTDRGLDLFADAEVATAAGEGCLGEYWPERVRVLPLASDGG